MHKFQTFIYSEILTSIEAALRLTLPSFLWAYSLDPNESFHTQKVCHNFINDPFFDEKPIFHILLPHTVLCRLISVLVRETPKNVNSKKENIVDF